MKKGKRQNTRRTPLIEALEPRILFSADVFAGTLDNPTDNDPTATLLDQALAEHDRQSAERAEQSDQNQTDQPSQTLIEPSDDVTDVAADPLPDDDEQAQSLLSNDTVRKELVIIDPATPDYQLLLDDLLGSDDDNRQIAIIMLDADRDGIDQLSDILANYSDLDAIHLISHGSDGAIALGNSSLDFDSLLANTASIQGWSDAFDASGDLLIYGCDLAASEDGQGLVNALGRLTGADVAASDDLTGSAALGGDWELEFNTGRIETNLFISAQAQLAWQHVLATVTFQQGDANGYSGTLDTELDSGSPGANNGANTSIGVDADNGSGVSQGLILFDGIIGTDVGDIPQGVQITSASLTVEVTNAGSVNIKLYQMLDSWDESSNWGDFAGLTVGGELAASHDAEIAFTPGTQTSVDVGDGLKATVQSWVDGYSNLGWGVINESTNGWDFDSSEGVSAPILTVSYIDPGSQASSVHTLTVDTADDVMDGDTTSIDALLANKGSDGSISLREALWATNNTTNVDGATPDVINFAIGTLGSQQAIVLAEALPAITDAVVLDAMTQGGVSYSGNPLIGIDGSSTATFATAGITVWTSDSTVRGFSVYGSDDEGIEVAGSSGHGAANNNLIENNWVGIDLTGAVVANADNGILVVIDASNNIVRNNVVAGNTGYGIEVRGLGVDGNIVQGNWVGTTGTGSTGVGNTNSGINIDQATNTLIGGTGANQGNVITNNSNEGINITGAGTTGTIIQGNIIGLDPDGATGSGNTDVGIALLTGADNTLIGGTTAQARNIISNNFEGIEINSIGNTVQGNYIGTDITGILDRGNVSDDGVEIQNSSTGNLIGGTAAGAGNLIAFNALDGVNIASGSGNTVLGNQIHSNTGLGIDLGTSGVTSNDGNDVDGGANNLQNYPLINSAELSGMNLILAGSLDTDGVSTQYRLEFFGNAAGSQDATNGEGSVYLGETTVTTDGSGDAIFSDVVLTSVTLSTGDFVTATATEITSPAQVGVDDQLAYGDSSEFAVNLAITLAPPQSLNFTISSTPSISEDLGETATFTITLSGDALLGIDTASVDINATGSAASGTDYDNFIAAITTATGLTNGVTFDGTDTLTFDSAFNGDTGLGAFSFTVDAVDDIGVEGTETIVATMSNPSATNGSASFATVSDSFTETSNTVITAHTPDSGLSWAQYFNNSTYNEAFVDATADAIQGGDRGSTENDTGQAYNAGPAPTSANQTLSFTLSVIETDSGTKPVGLFGRSSDINNFYYLRILPNGNGQDSISLWKMESGSASLLTSVDATIAAGDTFTLELTDGAKKAYHNDVEVLSSANNDLTAAGEWGFFLGNFNGVGGHYRDNWNIDNFIAIDGASTISTTTNITETDVNNAPVAQDDRVGLSFDGVNDYVVVADDPSLVMTNNLTMEAWINHSGSGTGSQIIIGKEGEYEIGITADTGEIKWAIADSVPSWGWHDTGYFVEAGEWAHIAVSYDGVASEAKTYVNGILVDTFSRSGAIGDVYEAFDELRIGGRENATDQRFDGLIDEVRIWNTTRTETDIQLNLDGLLAGNETGLVGNWRFDEGTGTTTFDQSASANHGTLINESARRGYLTSEDAALDTAVAAIDGVLANDLDADFDTLTATNLDTSSTLGLVTLNANGSFTYDPNGQFEYLSAGEYAIDTFSYTANDGTVDSNTATVTITITGTNDAPVLTGDLAATVVEAETYTLLAADLGYTDIDDVDAGVTFNTSSYSNGKIQVSGVDASSFTGTQLTAGAVTFVHDGSETTSAAFDINVEDGDEDSSTPVNSTFTFTVTAANSNDPVINSDGGGTTAAISTPENSLYVTTVTATDADLPAETLTYSISGGDDELDFTIDSSTGVLSFTANPDFESPADTGGNNVYDVIVQVSDGTRTDTQQIAVTVTDIADSGQYLDLFDIDSYSNSDGTQTWSTSWVDSDDADATAGSIKVSGSELRITPDAVNDNVYREVDLSAAKSATLDFDFSNNMTGDRTVLLQISSDGGANYDPLPLAVMDATTNTGTSSLSIDISAFTAADTRIRYLVTATGGGGPGGNLQIQNFQVSYVPNSDPTISSDGGGASASVNVAENSTAVTTVTALDSDVPAQTLTYAIAGGADSAKFDINASSGALTFKDAPDFETKTDTGSDNIYDVTVQVSDGISTDTQAIAVTVTDVNEAPMLTGDLAATVAEAGSYTLTATDLSYSDPDDVDAGVTFNTSSYSNGKIQVSGVDASSFTGTQLTAGAVTFVHDGSETTSAAFDINVEDGDEDSSTPVNSTFTFTVTPANDAPAGADKTVTTNEDTDYTFASVDFGFSDSNDSPANDLLNVIITAAPANGTLYVDSNNDGLVGGGEALADAAVVSVSDINAGRLKFKPASDANGAAYDSFTFQVQDDGGVANGGVDTDQSANTITIDVTAQADAASIGGDITAAVSEDGTLTDTGALTISDPDAGEAVFTTQTAAASTSGYGTVDLDAAGNWTYNLTNSNATVQALSEGETLADSFTATSADGSTQVVSVTITGKDDAAVIGGDTTAAVSEDGTLTDTGALTISDTDDGEAVFTTQTAAASTSGYGTVDLDAAGNWTYNLTNSNATVQALSEGETLADSFTATSADGSTQIISVTITGKDDAAVIGGDTTAAVSEDGTLTDTGALTISDTDDGEAVFTTQTSAASTSGYGTVDLDAAGNWTYSLTNSNATVQALSEGETLADSFTATSADGSTQVVSVTITGKDDAAVIGGDTTAAVSEDGTLTDTGALTISDTDDGEAVFTTQTAAASTSGYGTVDLDAAGNWTYSLTNSNATVQALSEGETLADSFTATSADGSTQVVTVTITGKDDAAVIGGDTTAAVSEDGTLTDTGALTISDTDDGEAVFTAQTAAASTSGYGTVDLDTAGNWTYSLTNSNATVQALSEGETLADSFTATSADGSTQIVSVTITGKDDAAVIGGDTTAAVSEDGTLTDTGALTISDTDDGEAVFTAQTAAASTSGYGTVDLDAAGNWTYSLTNSNATVQALSEGETLADSFTATSADGSTQIISVTITGKDDAAVIGGDTTAAVSEDGTLTDTGALTISDTDDGEAVFTTQTSAASTSGYGTVDLDAAGNWTYSLTNSNATVQALSEGETLADSFTATSADGSTQIVSVTITGKDDAAVIGGDTTAAVSEDGTLTDTGALTISDTDDGEAVFTTQTAAASTSGYGTVDLDAAGNWTYNLTNSNATVQALSEGETLADSFTATSADGSTQVVTVTITGKDDAAVIGGDTTAAVSEDGTLTDTGALTISDTDDGEAVFTTQTAAASTSGYGTVDLDAAGNWTYNLTNSNATVQALSEGETLADSFTATSADGSTQVVNVTITGKDDAAVIGGDTTAAVSEDGTLTDTGALTISDTDDGEAVFTTQTSAASTSGYGTVDLDAAGNWTYSLTNSNATVQALSEGETLADSFTATSADGSTQVVSVTITGKDDAAVIGGDTSAAVSEDGTLTDTGALTISDTDDGEAVFTTQTAAASTSGYGTVDLDAAGNWTYSLTNGNATVQALSEGETLADSFTATSADGSTQVVSVTITGKDDAAVIGGDTTAAVSEDGTLTDTGALTISDTDDGEAVFTPQTTAASTSGYGTVDLDAAGNWTYSLTNSNATVQALSEGETLADSFTATSADGSTQVVNVTITGQDDAAVIGGDTTAAVSEDGTLTDTGALTISDTDDGEAVFTTQTAAASTSGYGTVDLDAAGNWTYNLTNSNATVQALSEGETLADSFTATSADGSTQVVNVTITGKDDAAVIGGDTTAAVSEDGTLTDTGALTISDTDDGEAVFTAQTAAASTSGYGTVDLDAAGNWTYSLTNSNATVQALSEGETLADSFTATSADGSTQVVSVTITGKDDAAVIGGDTTAAVSEDGTLSDTGALTISDTDDGEAVFTPQTTAASTSGYGTVDLDAAGNWTYSLNNANATVQALSEGETLADSFTATSADGSTQIVSVTITGKDDAAVIGGDTTAAVSEDGTLTDTGALTISDTDDGEAVFTTQTAAASTSGYGTVDLDAAGNWTYSLTNSNATVQALSEGETLADSFTATSADGSTQIVSVTITGKDDAAVIGGDTTAAVSEDGTLTDTGALTISDTDDGEAVFTTQTAATSTSGYGTVDLDAAGNWTYSLTNSNATVQALSEGETLADSFTATSADGSTQVVSVTITGKDDAAVIGGDTTAVVSEDGTLTDTGALTISDTDDGEAVFTTQTAAASTSGYGTVDLDAAGNWTYNLTNTNATVQALSEGETLADSFTATSADGSTQVVTVTITGKDDSAVIGGDTTAAVSEDGTLSDSGALTITDTDDGEDVFTAQTSAASTSGYGTVDLDAAGNWTYSLNNANATVQALSEGETLADSFTATSADGSTQVVTVTITGKDDAAVIGGDTTAAVSEDGILTDSGALTISDTDDGEDVFVTQTTAASTSGYGTVDLDASGNWTYSLNNANATVQALSEGETLADSFTATSADGSTQIVTVTITGKDDSAVIGGDTTAAVSEDGTLTDTGALTISDTDDGEAVFTAQTTAASTSGYGTVDLDAAGNWTYSLNNANATVQALSEGETLADSFTATSADGSTQVVSVTITGKDDAAVIGGDTTAAVSEDGTLTDTGALTISDTDDGEAVFSTQTAAASTSGYGTVDLDAAGNWTYSLSNANATVQALSEGETLADSFTATSADGSTQVVSVTITGKDDAAVIGGDTTAAVSEDGTLTDTGALTISDTDDGEAVFTTQTSAASTSGYGTVDLDAAGNWTYSLTNSNATVQALSEGETLADSFTATSADGSTQVVTVTITGKDDAAVIGGDTTAAVSEDGTLTDTGALTISDTDDGEAVFTTQTAAASTSGYGTVDLDAAGNWTYSLTNSNATVQALSEGETLADSFTATSADGSTQVVSVTITGKDDAAVIGGDTTAAVSEDGTLTDTGALTISDTDDGEAVFTTQTAAASTSGYGTVDLDAAGNWTYSLTNSNATVQALSEGETLADSFTATSADGSTQVVSVTITGKDDAAVIGGDTTAAVSEDGTLTDTGALTISDTDDGEAVFTPQTTAASTSGYGTVDLDAAGNWTYSLNNANATVQALSEGETLADSFTATSADGSTQVVSVTITGKDDAAVIGGDTTAAVSEDGTLTDTGALTISDTDDGEAVFTTQTAAASTSGYGTVDLDAAGNWTYNLTNSNATVQALSEGETLADSFTATSADGSTQIVSVTITGKDDAAVIGGDTTAAVSEDGTLTDTGALTISDTDDGEAVFTTQTAATSTSGYGTVDLDAAGNWTYSLTNSNATVQALSEGETLADSFTATSADGSTQVVSVTITGKDDAAVIGGDTTAVVSEDGTLTDTGALTISDTDDGEAVFTTQTAAASTSGYGTVDLDAAGNWTYSLTNSNATVQALSEGETLADSFTATSADGSTQVVSVTITGKDDLAVIGGDTSAAVSEDGTLTDSGALTISDTDDGEGVFTTQTAAASTSGYGTVDLDAAGNWTYSLTNSNATVQALSEGETLADSFTATSADGSTQVVSVTITGKDDSAVIGGDTTAAVSEDGTLTDTGALTISDTDDGEAVFTTQTTAASTSGYGTVDLDAAGNWTYSLNNANATVQALSEGETLADSFTATSADGSTQVVSVTITGKDDAAVIGGDTTAAVSEDGTLTDTGALTISDTDGGEAIFTTQTAAASTSGYGTVDLDAAGNWAYSLTNSNATVQALSEGETLADSFTATSADGSTQVINVTITGKDDAAVIGGDTSAAVSEDGTLTDTGALTISDTDDGEAVFTTQTTAASTSGYGTVDLDAAGNWTYNLTNSNATVQTLSEGEILTDSFTATSADGSTQVVSVTITGKNDAPVIGGDDSGTVQKDFAFLTEIISTSGQLTISDVDSGESSFAAATLNGSYGELELQTDGNWSYTADNGQSAIQALASGESLTDIFTVTTADDSSHIVTIRVVSQDDRQAPGDLSTDTPNKIVNPNNSDESDQNSQEDSTDPAESTGDTDQNNSSDDVDSSIDSQTELTEHDVLARTSTTQINPVVLLPLDINTVTDLLTESNLEIKLDNLNTLPPKFIDLNNLNLTSYNPFEITPIASPSVIDNDSFIRELDLLRDDLDKAVENDNQQYSAGAEARLGITVSLSAGFVSWALRAGSLFASAMTVMPLWKQLDLLSIVGSPSRKKPGDEVDPEDGAGNDNSTVEDIFNQNDSPLK